MALVLNGSGITSANIADGTIVNADVADVAASKLTGALPAIDGSALTNLPAGGKVLQVVNAIIPGSSYLQTNGSNVNTPITKAITRLSTTSYVRVDINYMIGITTTGNSMVYTKLLRNGSVAHYLGQVAGNVSTVRAVNSISHTYLDLTPLTTTVTYLLTVTSADGANINFGAWGYSPGSWNNDMHITLTEIEV